MFSGQSLVLRARPRFVKTLGHNNDREDQGSHRCNQSPLLTVQTDLVPMRTQSQIAISRLLDGTYDVRIYKQPTFRLADFLQVVDHRIRSQLDQVRTSGCTRFPLLPAVGQERMRVVKPAVADCDLIPFKPIPVLTNVFKSIMNGLQSFKGLSYDVVKRLPEQRPSIGHAAEKLSVARNESKGLADKLISASHKLEAQNRLSHLSETRQLKQEFRHMMDEVRELRAVLMQDKQTAAPSAPTPAAQPEPYSSSWLPNASVRCEGPVLSRQGTIDQRNYVFGLTEMDRNLRIEFRITGLDHNYMESLTFGLTTQQPDHLNMCSLDAFGLQLRKSRNPRHWHVAYNAIPDPRVGQRVTLERTSDGIVMKRDKEEKLLLSVSPDLPLYPFLLFDGCVQSLQLS